MRRDSVAIFRLQLFKPSETFITAQADHLRRYAATYIGRTLFGKDSGRRVVVPDSVRSPASIAQQLSLQLFRNPNAFARRMRADGIRPDLIHAHFGIDGVYAASLAAKLRVPLITTLHGFDVTRTDADMLLAGRPALVNGVLFKRRLQAQGTLFICVSEFIQKAALMRGYPAEKLRLHYIGIDTKRLNPRTHAGEDGLLLHVARLVQKKGTSDLLRAFARILPEHPAARLVIVGDGPLRPALEAEARQLGIFERVEFLGVLSNDEVLAWDARAAIKVVPSITAENGDQEGLGIVNLEAGALGVPVVAYDSGGIAEAIEDGQTGLLAREGDVDGLASHLSLLLSDPQLRLRMGSAARRYVEAKFDIGKQTGRLEALYDEARDGGVS